MATLEGKASHCICKVYTDDTRCFRRELVSDMRTTRRTHGWDVEVKVPVGIARHATSDNWRRDIELGLELCEETSPNFISFFIDIHICAD